MYELEKHYFKDFLFTKHVQAACFGAFTDCIPRQALKIACFGYDWQQTKPKSSQWHLRIGCTTLRPVNTLDDSCGLYNSWIHYTIRADWQVSLTTHLDPWYSLASFKLAIRSKLKLKLYTYCTLPMNFPWLNKGYCLIDPLILVTFWTKSRTMEWKVQKSEREVWLMHEIIVKKKIDEKWKSNIAVTSSWNLSNWRTDVRVTRNHFDFVFQFRHRKTGYVRVWPLLKSLSSYNGWRFEARDMECKDASTEWTRCLLHHVYTSFLRTFISFIQPPTHSTNHLPAN